MRIPVVGCRKVAAILSIGSIALFMCNSSSSDNNPTGPTQNTSLYKQVSVSITASDPSLSIGTLTVARMSATYEYGVYWILPVTNNGMQTLSFINIENIYFKNNSGVRIDSQSLNYVSGSVMKLTSVGTFTNTCLQSGETGYIFGIQLEISSTSLYNSITSAALDSFVYSIYVAQSPKAVVNPSSYSVMSTILSVPVTNAGTAAAQFSYTPAIALLLNSGKAPLIWTYIDTTTTSLLPPNASCVLADSLFAYSGQTDYLLLFPDYSDANVITTHAMEKAKIKLERRSFGSEPEFLRALLIQRNNLEEAKRIQCKG